MRIAYDAGVLVAAERNDRALWADHRTRLELGLLPLTTAPVVAQVSRSARQVQLHRFLAGCEIASFDIEEAHATGALLAATGSTDVVDAHLVHLAAGARANVLTSDRRDLEALAAQLPSGPTIVSM